MFHKYNNVGWIDVGWIDGCWVNEWMNERMDGCIS